MLAVTFFLTLLIGGSVLGSITIWSLRNGIVPMPSSSKATKAIIAALPPDFQGTCYELGSGWGTLLRPLSLHCPAAKIIGYETSLVPYMISRLRTLRHSNVLLKRKDFFESDLSKADLLICYLYPGAMLSLQQRVSRDLKADAMVVSNTFALPHWRPSQVIEVNDLYRTKVYVYETRRQRAS